MQGPISAVGDVEPKLAIMESMVCKAKHLFLKVCLVRSLSEGSGFDEPHDEMELYQALWTGPFLCFEPGQQPMSLPCSERQPVGSLCYSDTCTVQTLSVPKTHPS